MTEVDTGAGVQRERDRLAVEAGRLFFEFLDTFVVDRREEGDGARRGEEEDGSSTLEEVPVYVRQLSSLKQFNTSTVYIDFAHVQEFNDDLAETMSAQYYRIEPYLKKATHEFVAKHMPEISTLPSGDKCTFWIAVSNLPGVVKLRDLRSSQVGKLVSLSGTVTRTSEVRPELLVASFSCNSCGREVLDVDQQFKYTEPPSCSQCHEREKWTLIVEKSTFIDWQRIRVQENASEIPAGSMPRTVDVIVRNDQVEKAMAGDRYALPPSIKTLTPSTALTVPRTYG